MDEEAIYFGVSLLTGIARELWTARASSRLALARTPDFGCALNMNL